MLGFLYESDFPPDSVSQQASAAIYRYSQFYSHAYVNTSETRTHENQPNAF